MVGTASSYTFCVLRCLLLTMPIELRCPGCDRLLRVPDDSAGKSARCPMCSTMMPVPTAPAPASSTPQQPPSPQTPFSPALPSHSSASSYSTEAFKDQAAPEKAPRPTESFNPYATPAMPESEYNTGGQFAPKVEMRHTIISFDDLFSTTWSVFSTQMGPMALLGLVLFVLYIAQQGVGYVIGQMPMMGVDRGVALIAQLVFSFVQFLVQVATTLGGIGYCLKLLRTGRTDISAFMEFGPVYLWGLLKDFIVGLVAGLIAVVCLIPMFIGIAMQDQNLTILFLILGLVLMIVFVYFLGMAIFPASVFIMDRKLGPIDALSESMRYMSGNRLVLFLNVLVVALVGGLFSCCTLYLGLILFLPYFSLFTTVLYMLITGQRASISPAALGRYVATP